MSDLFTQIIGAYSNIRIGVMQQGVDGDTNNATYARRALIRCQPTRDQAAFQAAMDGFPAADGSGEWYLNALRLGITGTTWASDARRMILTIGDETAAQWRVGTQHYLNANEELNTVIGALTLTYTAPPGVHAAAHLPLLKRGEDFRTQSGQTIPMTEDGVLLTSADTGGAITHAGLHVTVPEGAAPSAGPPASTTPTPKTATPPSKAPNSSSKCPSMTPANTPSG